jgi:peptidoglycan/xylan/chitin deacetylase (PgdA/CDA1 family)
MRPRHASSWLGLLLLACDAPAPASKATSPASIETPAPTPAPAPPPADDPPWSWSWERIESTATLVRAGRDLTPSRWPNDAKVVVALSFDLDNESSALRDGETSPALMAQGQYGSRAGLPRVLALLERHRIPATFFIPAVVAKLYPESIEQIVAAGHEVGLHGWIHERNSLLDEATERELLRRAITTLEQATGRRPVGIRTPSWDVSPYTLGLVIESGLLYDSSFMADDRPYELVHRGKPTGIVELPVEWILDDYPYFGMSRTQPIRPHMPPNDVLEIWKAEFDGARAEGTLFVLTMHPHIIGHRSRIAMLEELIVHMQAQGDVWFATHEQIAREAAAVLAR